MLQNILAKHIMPKVPATCTKIAVVQTVPADNFLCNVSVFAGLTALLYFHPKHSA